MRTRKTARKKRDKLDENERKTTWVKYQKQKREDDKQKQKV